MIQLFKSIFYKLLLTLVLTNLLAGKAFAINEQFKLDLNLTYDIKEDGVVEITKNIGIINLENELSVTSFTQNLEEYNYYDLVATDNLGVVAVKEIDEESAKRIVVPLRNTKIGKNQVNTLVIKYKSKDLLKNWKYILL